jgi:hypothetical protein
MYIYNVTVSIDKDCEHEWLCWMKEEHIPEVIATGCFVHNKILKVITEVDSGSTYSIQYFYENENDIIVYREQFASDLQQKHTLKFKDKYVAFRTLLQEV